MDPIKQEIDVTEHLRITTEKILFKIFQNIEWTQSDGHEILDLGCGPGVVTKEILMPKLPRNFKKLIGVDKRDDYITYAKNTYADERVMFDKMDIEEGVPSQYVNRFDLVTSFYCYQLVKYWDITLSMGKFVKPGGHLILTFELRTQYEDFMYNMSRSSKWAIYIDDNMVTAPEKTENLEEETISLIRCGFEIIHKEVQRYELPFYRLDYVAYLKSVDSSAVRMENEDREEYFSYIEENFVNRNLSPVDPETYLSKHNLLVIHAKKSFSF